MKTWVWLVLLLVSAGCGTLTRMGENVTSEEGKAAVIKVVETAAAGTGVEPFSTAIGGAIVAFVGLLVTVFGQKKSLKSAKTGLWQAVTEVQADQRGLREEVSKVKKANGA